MNQERIATLAAHLRKPETAAHFDFTQWLRREKVYYNTMAYRDLMAQPIAEALTSCGTSACIAGWTIALFAPEKSLKEASSDADWINPSETATDLLGIPRGEAMGLFAPEDKVVMELVTPLIAADTLEHYAATGKIKWPEEVLFPEREDEGDY